MKKIFILIAILLMLKNYAQNREIDGLKQKLSSSKEDTNKVWLLERLSENYSWSYADTATLYAQQGLLLAQKLHYNKGAAWCMTFLTAASTTYGNYAIALDYGYKALTIFKNLNDNSGIVNADIQLAFCYREQGDYGRALSYLYSGLQLAQANRFENDIIEPLGGIMASIYEKNNKLDSALFYAQKAYEHRSNWSGLFYILGTIHEKLGHHQLAIYFFKQTIILAEHGYYLKDIIDAYNGISNVYVHAGNQDSAIYYSNQAMNQQFGKTYPLGLLNTAASLADIYKLKNNTDSALKYLRLTISLKDSLFNQQKTREAENYFFNAQLQEQKESEQQQQLRNKIKLYALLGVLIVVFIIGFILYRSNLNQKRAYKLLQKQKEETDRQKQKVEITLQELTSTQAQLIQSEKMASLGELTAGIAHEIQNPLNFVNNFSDVNKELLTELKEEADKGNIEEVKTIANNVKENEEKINHHGKRADAIVKGMLQHSKQTKGVKEPTDINALCDEYLRLSYHGMRAKDKSFNADFKTDFDESLSADEAGIGKINIVPQDIARVLLNLFNNAFYETNEKKRTAAENYNPLVSVQTKKIDDKVEIAVSDNGNGIPQNIVDKIFQPFFTTKPTGQGTGLGLSLSYDIIKAHGGEIKVESKEGEGSKFLIRLCE